jgi:DNA-binding NarL/FixJ family response regulator
MKAVRILVVDDQEAMRRGVEALLKTRAGWEICGEASTGREAVAKAKHLKPHVVLMEIDLPELNGIDATRRILRALPKTEVLIYTTHTSEQILREALAAGARGYLLKSDPGTLLVAAVAALCQHEPFFGPAVSEDLLENYLRAGGSGSRRASPYTYLTSREREVIQLLAEGKSNKEVAAALDISIKTAETHRSNLMHKLRLHSINEIVRYAIRNNLIKP